MPCAFVILDVFPFFPDSLCSLCPLWLKPARVASPGRGAPRAEQTGQLPRTARRPATLAPLGFDRRRRAPGRRRTDASPRALSEAAAERGARRRAGGHGAGPRFRPRDSRLRLRSEFGPLGARRASVDAGSAGAA